MAKIKSATQKAIQQAFFEEIGLTKTVVRKSKNPADTVWPEKIIFVYDDNELVHVGNGVYRYSVSQTKKDRMVQLYIDDLKKWIASSTIKTT